MRALLSRLNLTPDFLYLLSTAAQEDGKWGLWLDCGHTVVSATPSTSRAELLRLFPCSRAGSLPQTLPCKPSTANLKAPSKQDLLTLPE